MCAHLATLLIVTILLAPTIAQSSDRLAGATPQPHRRGRGTRPHHYGYFSEKAPCALLERRYVPSLLETKWVDAANKWKTAGNGDVRDIAPYCALLVETLPDVKRMLELVGELMVSNSSLSTAPDADALLSHFNTTMQCGPFQVSIKEHIESLVAALRHPFAIQCPAPFSSQLPPLADMFDKGYVLLASWAGTVQAARNKYYLDAGAGIGYRANSNQYWMIESYTARGIALDRAMFWEAKTASGPEPYADVPPELFPVFQFFNIDAPESLADGRNLLNIVTRIAQPADFVSVKLDIDAPSVEDGWLRAILGDGKQRTVYAQLIDELFWEHHFDFQPMRTCCWGGGIDTSSQLADSMKMFQQLRQLGVRSHYWQ